jgi:predicted MFS family arabinose efflux permease
LLRRRPVRALLLTNLLLTLAIEIPFIVYGAWIETTFGLSFTALGFASTVVGLAEASAEFGTTMLTDRLGKRRSVLIGLLGLTTSLAVLPWLAGRGLAPALAGVVLATLSFEFGWVSLLPLATELAPDARATLVSLNGSSASLGRILGALAGGWLWQWTAIELNAGVGVACALAGVLLLMRGTIEEPGG